MRKIILIVMSLLLAVSFIACTKKKSEEKANNVNANISAKAQAADAGEVVVYNWTEYIPDEVLKQFEKETGIKVRYSTYDSNEAMYAKVKLTGGQDYDILVPSSYYINKMKQDDLIRELDLTKLSNFSKLDPKFLNQTFDPNNKYSIPFMWGSTGIAVNKKFIDPAKVSKWSDLWKKEYSGKVMLQNDMREVFQMALHTLGRPGNSTKEEDIKAAYEKLQELIPSVKLFNSDSPRTPFLMGEVHIGMIWAGEAYMAQAEDENIVYIYPTDGAILWGDHMVISKNAKNVENAYKFINFILRPDISAEISNYVGYSSPVLQAELEPYLEEKAKISRLIFPNEADLKNSEWQVDVGDSLSIYTKYWEKLKIDDNQ